MLYAPKHLLELGFLAFLKIKLFLRAVAANYTHFSPISFYFIQSLSVQSVMSCEVAKKIIKEEKRKYQGLELDTNWKKSQSSGKELFLLFLLL